VIDKRTRYATSETVLRRAPLIAIVCLLAIPASAWAALPGTPTISVGTTASCWTAVNGGRGGGSVNYCTYSGTQITLSGWTLKNSVCGINGTFTGTLNTFKAQLAYDTSSYLFTISGATPTTPIGFTVTCPLTWTGSAGLSWGKAITGGSSSDPVYTLHVQNRTDHARLVHCRVSYQNDLNQTRFYTWSPIVGSGAVARTQIRVWYVNSMHCSYTLTRNLTASGSG
jgi:hypothetical protein